MPTYDECIEALRLYADRHDEDEWWRSAGAFGQCRCFVCKQVRPLLTDYRRISLTDHIEGT